MQIKNSVFLVIGGASGLGAATAQMAAANGAKVVIADLQAEAGEKLAKEIGGKYASATSHRKPTARPRSRPRSRDSAGFTCS